MRLIVYTDQCFALSSGLTSSETRVNVRRMIIFQEAHAKNISFLASNYTKRPPMQREERLREIKERHKSHSCEATMGEGGVG